jgi:hypothetical protein
MLRVIHSQSKVGTVVLSDIEDGCRFNSRHILDASKRAAMKQKVVIPFSDPLFPAQAGYVDLIDTDNVLLSANHGCLSGLATAGLVTIQVFSPTAKSVPAITAASIAGGNLTITGTYMVSLLPDVSSLVVTGAGARTLTATQVTGGGGTWTDTSVVVPMTMLTGMTSVTSTVAIVADRNSSNVLPAIATPVVASATIGGGNLTVVGTSFLSALPAVSSLVITGDGAVTLTSAQIITGGGTVANALIVVPMTMLVGVVAATSSAKVTANTLSSNVVAVA